MHPMRHPRNIAIIGITFAIVAVVYALGAPVFHYPIEWAGVTLIGALAIAMSVMFYVLIAGSSND